MKIYSKNEEQLSFNLLLDSNDTDLEEDHSLLFKMLADVLENYLKEKNIN